MMTPRSFAGLAVGGTVALAGWGAAGFGTFTASHVEKTAAAIAERAPTPPEPAVATTATPATKVASADANLSESIFVVAAGPSAAAAPDVEPVSTDAAPKPPSETGMQLASVPTAAAVDDALKQPVRSIEPADQCVTDDCIDAYLWSLYERTPKIDSDKVSERHKVTVKKDGKTRTVTQTVTSYVRADFTWKDPAAAQRAGMPVQDYVIGGMDHGFKLKLYRALRMMDDAGLMPGITSAFRDDYRQSIATGHKASDDSSYHGGSRRGGYGHGLAADLVSVKGDTRDERCAASEALWAWIDAHEKQLEIGRPYRDRDPPHVGPIEGTEYIVKRSLANVKKRAAQTKKADKPRAETTKQLSRAPVPAQPSPPARQDRPG
jgi:hypothetical protein